MGDRNGDKINEHIAAALNAQGFLLQHRIFTELEQGFEAEGPGHQWVFEAAEYPVTARNSKQTRIDLVLSNRRVRGVHLCIECKRAHPKYKAWVFFGQQPMLRNVTDPPFYLETIRYEARPPEHHDDASHRIERLRTGKPVFDYYLEAALHSQGSKVSTTSTIEAAFSQVMFGHSGLFRKLMSFQEHNILQVIPVVVTTAQLFKAEFDDAKVKLHDGTLDSTDVSVESLPFVAVNYHASDDLAREPRFAPLERRNIQEDLTQWQIRTISVVQAVGINTFLPWLEEQLGLES